MHVCIYVYLVLCYACVRVYNNYITAKDSLYYYYHNQVYISSITVGAHVAAAASAVVLSTTHQLYALPVCVTRSRHSHRIDYNILLMLPFTSFHFYTHIQCTYTNCRLIPGNIEQKQSSFLETYLKGKYKHNHIQSTRAYSFHIRHTCLQLEQSGDTSTHSSPIQGAAPVCRLITDLCSLELQKTDSNSKQTAVNGKYKNQTKTVHRQTDTHTHTCTHTHTHKHARAYAHTCLLPETGPIDLPGREERDSKVVLER